MHLNVLYYILRHTLPNAISNAFVSFLGSIDMSIEWRQIVRHPHNSNLHLHTSKTGNQPQYAKRFGSLPLNANISEATNGLKEMESPIADPGELFRTFKA